MVDLVLTNVEDGVFHRLQELASRHGRAPTEEAKAILMDALPGPKQGVWAEVDAIYQRLLTSGRSFSDSAELLREDRDR